MFFDIKKLLFILNIYLFIFLLLLLFFFSSGVNYEAFENPNVVEVETPPEEENKITNTEEHSIPTDNRENQI